MDANAFAMIHSEVLDTRPPWSIELLSKNHNMVLHRDIVRWLQGLDLTYSLRNPIRDLSNGYVVAEILMRYYGSEIPMHSIVPGTSSSIKEDNWRQLSHIFALKNIHVEQSAIHDCINQRKGAAVIILSELFRVFKKDPLREVCSSGNTPEIRTGHSLPHYAKATAAFKVKDSNIERTVDELERKLQRVQVIYELQRENRPNSFAVTLSPVRPQVNVIPLETIRLEDPVFPTEVESINALVMRN